MLPVYTYMNNAIIEYIYRFSTLISVRNRCGDGTSGRMGTNLAFAAKMATEGGCPDYRFEQESWKRHVLRDMSQLFGGVGDGTYRKLSSELLGRGRLHVRDVPRRERT